MAAKRSVHQDPEYEAIPPEIQEKRIKLLEDNVRKQTKKKIETIIKTHFEQEISNKDAEIDVIDELLHEGRCMMDRLRACIITKYYATLGQEQVTSETSSPSMHPAVQKYFSKFPKFINCNSSVKAENDSDETERNTNETATPQDSDNLTSTISSVKLDTNKAGNHLPSRPEDVSSRAPRFKTKCKIVIGNISKFIPVWRREENDQSTHKWMIYVRGDKNNPNIENFVKKIRFLLHPSYRPTDIVEISNPPFHLMKRGWGEFPVRVQLHFTDPRNKPVDIIHNLKLDKTFTGLQTLGAETVVELQLFKPEDSSSINHFILGSVPETSSIAKEQEITSASISNGPGTFLKDLNADVNLTIKKNPNFTDHNFTLSSNIKNDSKSENVLKENNLKTVPAAKVVKPFSFPAVSNLQKRPILPKATAATTALSNSSATSKNNSIPNGINTTYVKCTDTEGRVLLVPQSSLLCIKSDKLSTSKTNNLSHSITNNAPLSKSVSDAQQLNSNTAVPSYILKVVPNQDSGQNQVLLIPMAEKKVQCSEANLQIKRKDTFLKSSIPPDKINLTPKIETFIKKSTPVGHTGQEVDEIKHEYYKTFEELLKRICQYFPLVKEDVDRTIFPFCASSLEGFQRWNIGKQRASEWRRAGMVRNAILNLLSKKPHPCLKIEDVWSRRKIMSWCRKNGFVPMSSEKMTVLPEPKWSGVELCSLTNASDLLCNLEEEKPNVKLVSDEEEEVEVVEIIDNRETLVNNSHIQQPVCHIPHLSEATIYVKEVSSQIGVELKPIEIEPQLYVPAVEEMILAACRDFAADLIGTSVNEGYDRLGGKLCPEEITVSDVYSAIKKSSHFDFLTNSFLGIPKDSQLDT